MPVLLLTIVLVFIIGNGIVAFLQWQGAPFVPSSHDDIDVMVRLAQVKKGERVVDLGSGDGAILIALAKKGIPATGYELNLLLVLRSRRKIAKEGLLHLATVHWKSFWDVPLGQYDVVMLYGIPHIMGRLEKKLLQEVVCGHTTRVLSNYFQFPNLKPIQKEGRIRVYRIGQKVEK